MSFKWPNDALAVKMNVICVRRYGTLSFSSEQDGKDGDDNNHLLILPSNDERRCQRGSKYVWLVHFFEMRQANRGKGPIARRNPAINGVGGKSPRTVVRWVVDGRSTAVNTGKLLLAEGNVD